MRRMRRRKSAREDFNSKPESGNSARSCLQERRQELVPLQIRVPEAAKGITFLKERGHGHVI